MSGDENMVLTSRCVHIWIHAVRPVADEDTAILSRTELARADRFVFDRDRHTFLAARVMLRRLLSRYENTSAHEWHFTTNEYGRPRIASPTPAPPLFFNLAHTNNRIVFAVARFPSVGIDIESEAPDEFQAIASRFFSPKEIDWLQAAQGSAQAYRRFLQLWTLKEAFVKALGTGLATPLDAFSLLPVGADTARLIDPGRTGADGLWVFRRRMLNEGCAMAIAVSPEDCAEPDFEFVDLS